jgi:hypothetical protein
LTYDLKPNILDILVKEEEEMVRTYGTNPITRHIRATFISYVPYRVYSMQPQHYGCVVGEVITRKRGEIPGCIPAGPNTGMAVVKATGGEND